MMENIDVVLEWYRKIIPSVSSPPHQPELDHQVSAFSALIVFIPAVLPQPSGNEGPAAGAGHRRPPGHAADDLERWIHLRDGVYMESAFIKMRLFCRHKEFGSR